MELKRVRLEPWIPTITAKLRDQRLKRLLVFALYTCLIFALGYSVHPPRLSFDETVRSLRGHVGSVLRSVRGVMARPNSEHIAIDIKHRDYMQLAYQREIALTRGILTSDEDDFVPATIRHNDRSVKVKLRLKGDSTDHLEGDKWSFRIKVRGDNTLFGMKQFSVQHPKTRNYVYEWIFHQALKREGLVALRYDFINVTVNGKDLGIYALEEHFDKRLIENNQHREGPIVRFNEDPRWAEEASQYASLSRDYTIFTSFLPIDIDTYQTNKALSEPASFSQHRRAIYLLESLRRGKLTTSEVFDVQKLARLFAVADLMGAQHSINWANMRFYYNPITSRLEPIGFDGDSGKHIRAISPGLSPLVDPIYLETIFNDLSFYKEYVRTLERIAEPSYLNTLLTELDDELRDKLDLIYSEFPSSRWPARFFEGIFYRNQEFIRNVLNPVKGINAYFRGASEGHIELELGNIQSRPIEVLSVTYQDFPPLKPIERTILPGRTVSYLEPLANRKLTSTQTVDYRVVRFAIPEDLDWSEVVLTDLIIKYKLVGTSRMREEKVIPWSYLGHDFVEADFFTQESNLHALDFLVVDESSRRILVAPGTWDLDRGLIIPRGYRVIAREGTRLNLTNSAMILSHSPLEFIGSEDSPIVIQSRDSTGQGLVVMGAEQISTLKHVSFRNLSNPSQNGWELTGAVTFYESPVALSDIQFVGNRSEDALNIVRSNFSIEKTLFSQTFSDAFDADFAGGRIATSTFLRVGGDAIDASGSSIEIENIFIDGAGDKGLSIGERSQAFITDSDIRRAEIAVASKDLSQITVKNIHIEDGEIGLTAYQKKSEFGAASMEVEGLEMTGVSIPYLVEEKSKVVVDQAVIEASHENVFKTLYAEGE